MNKFVLWHIWRLYLVFLSWSLIFFSISASVRVSNRGHHWSASPVLRMAISTVGNGFSLRGNIDTNKSFHKYSSTDSCIWAWFSHIWFYVFMLFLTNSSNFWCFLRSLILKASLKGAGELPKGVGPLVPAKLPSDAVRYGGDKLSSQTQFGAKLQSKRLWWVLPLWHVPLKLVHQRNVTHMDVKLWNIEDLKYIPMQRLLFRASSVSMRINWHQQQTKSKQALALC